MKPQVRTMMGNNPVWFKWNTIPQNAWLFVLFFFAQRLGFTELAFALSIMSHVVPSNRAFFC